MVQLQTKYLVYTFLMKKVLFMLLTLKMLILEKEALTVLEEALRSSSRVLSNVPLHHKAYLGYMEGIHLYSLC